MDDLTPAQTASDNQPQGTPEIPDNAVLPPTQLSRRKKIILGIATFGLIFGIGMFFLIVVIVQNVSAGGSWGGLYLIGALAYPMIIFYFLTLILSIAIIIIYFFNVIKNKRIPKAEKIFWAVVFFHGFFYSIKLIQKLIILDINLGIFFIMPYIAMSIYWYRYIWKETIQIKFFERKYWYIYALVFLFIIIYLIQFDISEIKRSPIISEFNKAQDLKKQEIKEFENAQMVKAYLPSTLKGEWGTPQIDSSGGEVKASYRQEAFELQNLRKQKDPDRFEFTPHADLKSISMVEIVTSKKDLNCNNEALLEPEKMFPDKMLLDDYNFYDNPIDFKIPDKTWKTSCEELSVSGEKAIIGSYERDTAEYSFVYDSNLGRNKYIVKGIYHIKRFLMVFDKGNTRIYLHYWQRLQDYLMSTENWSKSDLIRVAENLRPVEAKDFGL